MSGDMCCEDVLSRVARMCYHELRECVIMSVDMSGEMCFMCCENVLS